MKTSLWDFVLSGLALTLLGIFSWFLTFVVLAKVLIQSFASFSSLASVLCFLSLFGLSAGFALQILLHVRPLKTGEFTGSSKEFTYWKLLTMIHYFGARSLEIWNIAPTAPLIARLFGARIGGNTALGGLIDSPYFVSIGNDCILGHGAMVAGNMHVSGKTLLGQVNIGNETTIGFHSLVLPNTEIGSRVTIAPYSVVIPGTRIPDGETWKGNPARKWQ